MVSGSLHFCLRRLRPCNPLWDDMLMAGVSLLLIWLGWIGVLAFGTQALRRAHPGPSTRRWTAVLGAIGTTIPWFGLAWASLVAA